MPFRNKEDCYREAERLGIAGVDKMSWPQLQKVVSEALKLEELGVSINKSDKTEADKAEANLKPKKNYRRGTTKEEEDLKKFYGQTIKIAPELAPERYRLIKYDEVLGDDYETEERKFDIDQNTGEVFDLSGGKVDYGNEIDAFHDYTTGTYRLKKRSDRKVVAMSSVPKENAGMIFRPGIDYATVVTWKGRSGYLWKHWSLPNVKSLLVASGHYQEYKHLFKDEPNVWYAAGKMLVCDPHLVHRVLAEIEEKERRQMEDDRIRNDYYRGMR